MTKQRKMILTLSVLYTVAILYFMFFAFGRTDAKEHISGYTFIFVPDSFFKMPALTDLLHPSLMTLVDLGNIAAFIPFGLLIPLFFRVNFVRFMTLFFVSILVLETLQALTFLGSFDMNDAVQNSLGAAIGFGAYKLGFRAQNDWRNLIRAAISSAVLFAGVWGLCGIVDQALTKEEGPFVAINEWIDSSGNLTTGLTPHPFSVNGQDVTPQYNLYAAGSDHPETFTYTNEEEMILSFHYGIPEPLDDEGSIRLSVNGREVLTSSGEEQRLYPELFPATFEMPVEAGSELRITIEGNQILWDVGYRKMQYFWN
ncbi:VanZ family protein [Paenibacillus sp. 598K]|uniref:VanZ family protein n=1 Tax=Paenibacillus sp. 598K TaxID=1117987 RepID=UPI000FF98BDF|nr:VanZ family protein [Paenibacillus sp. 598K]GBF73405.1 VanZ family protein [Paenibacillus sp. 598K]